MVEAPGIENGRNGFVSTISASYDACDLHSPTEKLNELDPCGQALARRSDPESGALIAALQASLTVVEASRSGATGAAVTPSAASGQAVEQSLANALQEAARAQRWDVVAELSRILEARTRPANVVPFRRGGRP
jgi:hypothetical protein